MLLFIIGPPTKKARQDDPRPLYECPCCLANVRDLSRCHVVIEYCALVDWVVGCTTVCKRPCVARAAGI